MYNTLHDHWLVRSKTTLHFILRFLTFQVGQALDNVHYWILHVSVHHRRAGRIYFNINPDHADGFITYYALDGNQKLTLHRLAFSIDNLWLIRAGRKPPVWLLWEIETAASTVAGVAHVYSIVWGLIPCQQQTVSPFDTALIPTGEALEKIHHERFRVQRWFIKHFPASAQSTALPRDSFVDTLFKRA